MRLSTSSLVQTLSRGAKFKNTNSNLNLKENQIKYKLTNKKVKSIKSKLTFNKLTWGASQQIAMEMVKRKEALGF